MAEEIGEAAECAARRWQPLGPRERRVLGVLAEKAKTTPDTYPLTLNALTAGCNQKSNRSPLMNLAADEVAESLERLRALGAVTEIHGAGRVPKYRHLLYDWLEVGKVELAVMAELLLRGEQTVGELRTRASRMEPIASLAELEPILQSLIEKGLVLALTPPGRGQIVTHALYPEPEREQLEAAVAKGGRGASGAGRTEPSAALVGREEFERLCVDVAALRDDVQRLREQVTQLERHFAQR